MLRAYGSSTAGAGAGKSRSSGRGAGNGHGPNRGGGGVSAQYWKVLMITPANPGLNSMSMDSVKFLNGAAEASTAGATYAQDPNGGAGLYSAEKAFDGMTSSSFNYYNTNMNAPQPGYCQINFPAPITVTSVKVGYGSGVSAVERMADFTIQYSTDGVAWTTYKAITGHGVWTDGVYETFTQ